MTAPLALGLVFHQHQPVGNFDFVFEELLEKSYEPLLSCLERHPAIRAGLHYSGPLIDWLELFHPEYLNRVAALVASGQIEVLGGGYYEPILPSIIEEDRIGQLAKMRDAVSERFGATATGAWLTERVWEPGLPTSLEEAGYGWTLVDDVHFAATGVPAEKLHGWYLTEDQGRAVGVFGSSTQLRYMIPWSSVEDCIGYLRARAAAAPGSLIVMGDDGEKFGGWPTTFQLCWEEGWVDAFFDALERESSWLETVHLGEWKQRRDAEGLIYLPTMSYMEMGEWSLPADAQHALERAKRVLDEHGAGDLQWLLRGGHWRNFLVRYPEVNLLQKRAMELSRQARDAHNAEALDHVWQAECNCPYWHGVFGGVYLENIRHANFGHVAKADTALFAGAQSPEIRDWDFDGRDEVGLRSKDHFALVAPALGGAIIAWDLREAGWNLTHVVALRPEAYHDALTRAQREARDEDEAHNIHGETQIKDKRVLSYELRYDEGRRAAAQDTLLPPDSNREAYEMQRNIPGPAASAWSADGQVAELSCGSEGLHYEKQVSVGEVLEVMYSSEDQGRLFSEWNLSLPGEPKFEHGEGWLRVTAGELVLEATHNGNETWQTQVFSVSNTEGGVELAPQGWSIVFAGELGPNQEAIAIRWSHWAAEGTVGG